MRSMTCLLIIYLKLNKTEQQNVIQLFLYIIQHRFQGCQSPKPVFYIVFNSVFNSYFVYRNLKLILREQCIIYCREIIIRNIICSVFIHLYVNFFFHLIAIRRVSEFALIISYIFRIIASLSSSSDGIVSTFEYVSVTH